MCGFLSRSSRLSRSSTIAHIHEQEGTSTTDTNDDSESTVAIITPPNRKVKRVDRYWSSWSKTWKYRNSGSKVSPEALRPVGGGGGASDPW